MELAHTNMIPTDDGIAEGTKHLITIDLENNVAKITRVFKLSSKTMTVTKTLKDFKSLDKILRLDDEIFKLLSDFTE